MDMHILRKLFVISALVYYTRALPQVVPDAPCKSAWHCVNELEVNINCEGPTASIDVSSLSEDGCIPGF